MKNFLTSLIFLLGCFIADAQQSHFIYLQTEGKQPFFVKLDNKILNSLSLGFLIIPKLNDSLYSVVIGFPGTNFEQEFNCSINNKDLGFIIKSGGEKQWQLVNVQTHDVIIPGDVITKQVIAYEKQTDLFSTMLANAVHDSTILRKGVVKEIIPNKSAEQNQKDSGKITALNNNVTISRPDSLLASDSAKNNIAKITPDEKLNEQIPKDTIQKIISNTDVATLKPENPLSDSGRKDIAKETLPEKNNELNQKDSAVSLISNNDVAITKSNKRKKSRKDNNALQDSSIVQNEIVKTDPENKNNELALLRSDIKRKLKKSNKDGIEMMYVDDAGDIKDTIRVLIPSEKKKKKDDETVITTPVVTVTDTPKEDQQTAAVKEKNKALYKISKEEKEIIKEANSDIQKAPMINSDCKNFASDDDFLKIRKKMVAENNDEDMIKVAKKIFRTRCFTTERIKNLSTLFLTDEGKYMFFDAAYPFVSDSDLYYTLEKQLSDNNYITRFKALVHK